MSKIIKLVAVSLIAVGVVAMLAPSFGFSTVASDRGVQISTAENDRAFLGVDDVYGGGEIVYNGGTTIEPALELTNRLGTDADTVDVQIESVQGYEDNTLDIANHADLFDGLEDGETVTVELECSRDVEAETDEAGTTVEFSVNALGESASVTDLSVSVSNVRFDCEEDDIDRVDPEPGVPENETNAPLGDYGAFSERGSGNSMVWFDFTNEDDQALTIEAIEIRSTSKDDVVGIDAGGNDEGEIRVDGEDTTVFSSGQGNQALRVGDGGAKTDETVPVGTGQTGSVKLGDFNKGSINDRAEMVGTDVTIVLYFEEEDQDAVRYDLTNIPESEGDW